jgi:hypothetical protein
MSTVGNGHESRRNSLRPQVALHGSKPVAIAVLAAKIRIRLIEGITPVLLPRSVTP